MERGDRVERGTGSADRFRFGKHRGQRFDTVPKDYLRWIAEAPNSLRPEVKFSARRWLQQLEVSGA
jgi:hypothetical protein